MMVDYIHEVAIFLAIVLTIISQLLLRIGSRQSKGLSGLFANYHVICGYLLFSLVVILTIFAMQEIPLKNVIAWNSSTFILVPLAGKIYANDIFTKKMLLGTIIIIAGTIVYLS